MAPLMPGGVSPPGDLATLWCYLELIVEWAVQISVPFQMRPSMSLHVGLGLHSDVPGLRTFDILRLGDWQALNLMIFVGPWTVKVALLLHPPVPSATVSIPGDIVMC